MSTATEAQPAGLSTFSLIIIMLITFIGVRINYFLNVQLNADNIVS